MESSMNSRERIRTIIDGGVPDRCGFWLGNPHDNTWPLYLEAFGIPDKESLRRELGDDYRIDMAVARVSAIQGADADKVRTLVQKSRLSKPTDNLAAFQFELDYAQIFGIAGMAPEAIEIIDSILQPPSDTSVYMIDLDPAFDGIRDDPEFVAMMERHR